MMMMMMICVGGTNRKKWIYTINTLCMTMEGRWNIKSREPKTATEFFDGPADTERIYDKTHTHTQTQQPSSPPLQSLEKKVP
mmetsp:Transcript_21351/g.59152  ORF Transcript_21351/g.59152 Transcript_21351/m.59152 type:complete len:82 (-) Transcript_21351:200-445(-)